MLSVWAWRRMWRRLRILNGRNGPAFRYPEEPQWLRGFNFSSNMRHRGKVFNATQQR